MTRSREDSLQTSVVRQEPYDRAGFDQPERIADYVDKILRGAKVADLPWDYPTKYELVINLRTAALLGLTIPQALLVMAEQIK